MSRTYLSACLKDDALCRWPDAAMPIQVYIAPFTWYEKKKQQESMVYRQMVLDALDAWRRVSNGLIRFNIVDQITQSQIDIKWRRVDRKSLGHCTYEMDNLNRMFSCSIQIGISDGLLHAAYQDAGEVQHTILHEIGHALGLIGHSDEHADIMYVPHQYGIHALSPRDAETIRWLYQLPVGFQYKSVGAKYQLKPGFSLNDVIDKIENRILGEPDTPSQQSNPAPVLATPDIPKSTGYSAVRVTSTLDEQHHILSEMGRFYLKTQNIRVDAQKQVQLRRLMLEKQLQNRLPPPLEE